MAELPEVDPEIRSNVLQFYRLVAQENEVQNLTRLISPRDFFEGHVRDVVVLLTTGFVSFPAMDLGSGCGVPGLLAAVLSPGSWILCESEARKAAFLARATEELGLSARVRVFHGRAEDFLRKNSVSSVVVRAVGPMDRIMGWIGACSTWNNLVLLKGPKWDEEMKEFRLSKHRDDLVEASKHSYSVGEEKKFRIIVRMNRVLRGTNPLK